MTESAVCLVLVLGFGFVSRGGKTLSRLPGRYFPHRLFVPLLLSALIVATHIRLLRSMVSWTPADRIASFHRQDARDSLPKRVRRTASSVPPTPPPGPVPPPVAPSTASSEHPQSVSPSIKDSKSMSSQLDSSRNMPTMPPLPFGSVPGVVGSLPPAGNGSPSVHRKSVLSSPAAIGTLSACCFIVVAVLTVLIFGLRRARRDPARYGPRAADPEHPDGPVPSQSRAAGLTRAVLDTFPVTTWGALRASSHRRHAAGAAQTDCVPQADAAHDDYKRTSSAAHDHCAHRSFHAAGLEIATLSLATLPRRRSGLDDNARIKATDDSPGVLHLRHMERPSDEVRCGELDCGAADATEQQLGQPGDIVEPQDRPLSCSPTDRGGLRSSGCSDIVQEHVSGPDQSPPSEGGANAAEHGRDECCAICTEAFSSADEVRVLPCLGHHHFHVQCIDSWLYINSACPLCRHDLQPPTSEDDRAPRIVGESEGPEQEDAVARPSSSVHAVSADRDAGGRPTE